MHDLLADAAAEGPGLLVRSVAAVVLTLFGGAVEASAISSLMDGALAFGLWKVYVGGVALYAGLFVFGPEVLEMLEAGPDAAT